MSRFFLVGLALIFAQVSHIPRVANRKPSFHVLNQHFDDESDAEVTERIQNILFPLGPRSIHSEKPDNLSDGSAEFVEDFLSSLFPGLVFHGQHTVGNDKAAPADAKGPKEFSQKTEGADVAATPGSSKPSPTTYPAQPNVTEPEQAQVDHTNSFSSIEHIRNNLSKLQADFVLPTELDHYAPSADDNDNTAPVSPASSSELAKLIPYTSTNKPVYKYESELSGLLEELDRIESHGDVEVRDKRKETVKAVEKALEGVEYVVGVAVKERVSFIARSTPVAEELLKGFDVGENIVKEVVPASTEEWIGTPVVVEDVVAPGEPTPIQPEATIVVSIEERSPAEEATPEPSTPAVSDNATTTLLDETSPTEPDIVQSTSTATPEPVELSTTEPELTEPQLPSEEVETEEVSSPSSAEKPQLIESEVEDGDWSEIEN